MEERNVDLEIPLSREQWSRIGKAAQHNHALGYDWKGDEAERIHVYLRDEEARGLWERLVSDEGQYGAHRVEIAQFVFNDGRPFAHLEALPALDEPSITDREETASGDRPGAVRPREVAPARRARRHPGAHARRSVGSGAPAPGYRLRCPGPAAGRLKPLQQQQEARLRGLRKGR